MTSLESYVIALLSLSCTLLLLLLHQLTESATHSPSTSALQVPRFSVDQQWKSLATKSYKRQTTKANGMKLTILFRQSHLTQPVFMWVSESNLCFSGYNSVFFHTVRLILVIVFGSVFKITVKVRNTIKGSTRCLTCFSDINLVPCHPISLKQLCTWHKNPLIFTILLQS